MFCFPQNIPVIYNDFLFNPMSNRLQYHIFFWQDPLYGILALVLLIILSYAAMKALTISCCIYVLIAS